MAENTKIEWAHHTFNPWIGCTKVSAGCQHCYAERDMDRRLGKVAWGPSGTRVMTGPENWAKPRKWDQQLAEGRVWRCNKCSRRIVSHAQHPACSCGGTGDRVHRERVFCASLADVFEGWGGPIHTWAGEVLTRPYLDRENQRDNWQGCDLETHQRDPQGWQLVTMNDLRAELFRLIDATPNLDWLLLTKRPENILRMWGQTPMSRIASIIAGRDAGEGKARRKNVWLGTSVEDQAAADTRRDHLRACRDLAPVLFVSSEPRLGPIDWTGWEFIDQLICGGESGHNARPLHPAWPRADRDWCQAAGVAFHFKQWGEWSPFATAAHYIDRVLGGDCGGPGGLSGFSIKDGKLYCLAEFRDGRQVRAELIEPKGHRWGRGNLLRQSYVKVGKKHAGRLLDGQLHDGLPDGLAQNGGRK